MRQWNDASDSTTPAGKSATAMMCAVVATLMFAATPARAQERRRLGEDDQWQKEPAYPPDSPEGQVQAIRRALAADDPDEARDLADEWLERYPVHPLTPEVYLLRGDAKVAQRNYYSSLYDYEFLIRTFPSSEMFHKALEREYELAVLFLGGVKRKLWGMRFWPFGQSADDEAEEILIRIQERAPGSELGERASLTLADYYFDSAQMHKAAEAYDIFLLNYPRSQHRERAMRRVIQSNLATFKGPRFDPTGLLDAAARLRAYQAEFPAAAERMGVDALLVRIEESLALKHLYHAQWYERREKPISAAYMYRRVVQDYPRTAAAQEAIERLRDLDPKYAAFETKPTGDGRILPDPYHGGGQDAPRIDE